MIKRQGNVRSVFSQLAVIILLLMSLKANSSIWDCEILPAERKQETDPMTGIEVTYITTNKSNDTNLYFHDRCWLMDGNIMIFNSDRTGRNEIFGYIVSTGELIRFNREADEVAKFPLASRNGHDMYVAKGNAIYVWTMAYTQEPESSVQVTERKLCDYPDGSTQLHGLNENADGTLVSYGYTLDHKNHIAIVKTKTGQTDLVTTVDYPIQHIQFSWTRPDLLSYARSYGSDTAPEDSPEEAHARIWFVNVNTKTPVPSFYQVPGELVTHECWWVNDQITFIGGHRKEEGHMKVLDLRTNEIRIIGAGAWMEGVEARDLAAINWWHGAGSPDGRWVIADNWHGHIALFDAANTRMRYLTKGHRTYGSGAHPHVGWDLHGKSVEFTSNKMGNPDVCIVEIPEDWD
jgi:oligogalacturonide lyase